MIGYELEKLIDNLEVVDEKIIVKDNLREIIQAANEYEFDILKSITAIDRQDSGIELIYHIYSIKNEEDLYISYTTRNNEVDTVSDIYKSAIAEENEIYDMFGITFVGNDILKRLYMPEDWKGHPLRKDYIQDDTRLDWNGDNNTQT